MKSLRYLNKYFLKYKWQLLAGVFFVIANNYFAVKMPVFLKVVTDNFINGTNEPFQIVGFDIPLDIRSPWSITIIYMSLILLAAIFLFLRNSQNRHGLLTFTAIAGSPCSMRSVVTDQDALGRVQSPEHQKRKGSPQFLCRGSFHTL